MNSETSSSLKIKLLNISKKELSKDLEKAVEFDQSQLFKKLYETEYGTPGGEPYGALIGDYEFTNHPEDMATIEKISNVSAAAFCPFISAASSNMLGMDKWTDLSKPRDLEKIFEAPEYIKWRSFRETEDSRFVSLVMPRVLSRLPYGKATKEIEEFDFEEAELNSAGKSKPVNNEDYTWMNAAYVMGAKMTDSFAKTSFCTSIRGIFSLVTMVIQIQNAQQKLGLPTGVKLNLANLVFCHFVITKTLIMLCFLVPKQFKNQKNTINLKLLQMLLFPLDCHT
jgi:type VI secretion system protein ImpC